MQFCKRSLLEEILEREVLRRNVPNILENAFDKQVEFIKDPHRRKAIFCTRRSAKSYTAGLYLVKTALEFNQVNCLFIGLTRSSAEAIVWKDILKDINKRYNLEADFNESKLRMAFKNGSQIMITGVDADEDEMTKLLGRKFKLVCIDEASMYTISIKNLIDLLEPAIVDQDGTICLMGTASNFPRGIFYEITTGENKGWRLFQWSAFDNPYVSRQWQMAIEKIKTDRPEYMQTPQFKQWYLNQWVIDDEKLIYRFNIDLNLLDPRLFPAHLPFSGWTFVLGVDTGWEDDSAFVLTAYHMNDSHLYILKVFKQKKMTFDDVVRKIEEFMAHPQYAPQKVIIDGANKQGVESMKQRSNVPFEYADKKDKATFIEILNSDMLQGKIKILDTPENRVLWEEMSSLVWVTEGEKIKYPKKEHPALPNHACDAHLYAWRCGYHYASTSSAKKVTIYSKDWYQAHSEGMWEKEREHLQKKSEWPEEGSLGDLSF